MFPKIIELAVDYELIRMTPQEVDTLNVFQARMEGFRRAIEILVKRTGATYAVIDGNKKPDGLLIETDFLVKADAILPGVSCASIVAKHSHTQYIKELCKDELYKKYGFESQKKSFDFLFDIILRAWCNGSIRVSKTFDLGSNPSARAK